MKTLISFLVSFIVVFPLCAQNYWSKSFEILPSNDEVWGIVISNNTLYLQTVGFCTDGSSCSSLVVMNNDGSVIDNYNLEQGQYIFNLYDSMISEKDRVLNLGTSYLVDSFYNGTISSFQIKTNDFIHKKLSTKKGLFVPTNIAKWKNTNKYFVLGQFQSKPFEAADAWCGVTILDSTLNIIIDTILNKDFYNLIPTDMYQDSDSSFTYFVKGCKYGKCSGADGIKLYSYRVNIKGEVIDSMFINKSISKINAADIWAFVEPSSDDSYILTWQDSIPVSFNTYEPYINKFNKNGNSIWKTNFKIVENYSDNKIIFNLRQLKNGDYLIVGSNDLSYINSLGYTVGWAARINTNGKILWERNYYNTFGPDVSFNPYLTLYDCAEGNDGSIYMSGLKLDTIPGISPAEPNFNNWVIKVGPDGCLTPGCTDSLIYVATNEIKNLKQDLLQIVPTLANQNVTVIWKDAFTDSNHLIIRNIEGSLLMDIALHGKTGQANIDINNLPLGMYFATIQGNGWQSMPVKFVKQ